MARAAAKIDGAWAAEIRSLLRRAGENGGPFWSRADGNIAYPAAFCTFNVLWVLGELGASVRKQPIVRDAAEFLFGHQESDGSFRITKDRSRRFPCYAARIVAAMGRIGAGSDPRLEATYGWLLASQAEDGGWRCPMARLGNSSTTDASNPGTLLVVLDALRFRKNRAGDVARLNRGVEFLLRHWETRVPLGPCFFGIGSRFSRVEYPFLRYNLFYYLYVLSHYPRARRDKRFREAFERLESKLRDGRLPVEAPHQAWQRFSFARKGQVSELATAHWRVILRNLRKPTKGGRP